MIFLLVAAPLLLAGYKVLHLGFRGADLLPQREYRVTYALSLDGHGSDTFVRTYLPVTNARQQIGDEQGVANAFSLSVQNQGQNRVATWNGNAVPDNSKIEYSLSVRTQPIQFNLPEELAVPGSYPESLASQLRADTFIQVDAPEVKRALRDAGAEQGNVKERLERIFGFVTKLKQRPFKGTTDALTALRLGEASCNGKSRLFVAMSRAAGIPARLVGGLILGSESKRTSHQWVEAWIAGHWVPFCPTNKYFARLPESYLSVYVGDQVLFSHTPEVNFDYAFSFASSLSPSPKAKAWTPAINVWALFERLHFSLSLLRTVLMLPVGALVVVLFRNVVGVPTYGVFLPALLAAAAGETGAGWGVLGVLVIVAVTALLRGALQRLRLLHSPTLAILLAGVTTTMLATTLLAEHFQLAHLTYMALFPIAVLAITAERFYLSAAEEGVGKASKELVGTLLVMISCYTVMNSLVLQALLIGFPELLLLVVAANIYLGRWVGLRVSEYVRFRPALLAGRSS